MPLSSCFSSGDPSSSSSSPGTASSCTSVYSTHLGAITLTWSRSTLGLVLTADLALGAAPPAARFVVLPWLPWRRRGSKRFSFPGAGAGGQRRHAVAFSWDLSRARLAPRRPEPLSRYSVHVSVDGELALTAGDLPSTSPTASAGVLLSRRESAGGFEYATSVAVAGEEHEVSVGVDESGGAMWVAVDGAKALQVRRLRWKFRGSERLDGLPTSCGHRVHVTWDLHGWLFGAPDDAAAAVFVLRFDPVEFEDAEEENEAGAGALKRQGSFSFRDSHGAVADGSGESWCSSEASERKGWRRGGPFRSGSDSSPTVSVASAFAASSSAVSAATVAGWDAAEEAALQDGGGGFSLVVYLRKKRKRS